MTEHKNLQQMNDVLFYVPFWAPPGLQNGFYQLWDLEKEKSENQKTPFDTIEIWHFKFIPKNSIWWSTARAVL